MPFTNRTAYEVGKIYALEVKSIINKYGFPYIVVSDGAEDYTVKPYDYQTEYSSIPRILSCYVRSTGSSGKPWFEQCKEDVLKDRYYLLGHPHKFNVDEVHRDVNTDKIFYVLSDEFGITHRYYPSAREEKKNGGNSITLFVRGIVHAQPGRNNARLDLVAESPAAELVWSTAKPVYPRIAEKKNFGTENSRKEFKSSIAYPAGDTKPDIDKQLGIICRTIAGFMNADGGTLYIGVSDNGCVCGIENDYCHLNDGEDEFTYKENDDYYMQKITNRVCSVLGRIAGTLINMKIEEEDGKKYCTIEIGKASRPIWFNGNRLFVRIVTTNRMLKDDEITRFVIDRVSKVSFVKQKQNEPIVEDDSTSEMAQTAAAVTVPPTLPVPIPSIAKKEKKVWRHITFYNNGEWSFQREKVNGTDVVCNAEIPSDARRNNLILILAYENGHVEATYLKKVLYGRNGLLPEGNRRGMGLCLNNGKATSVFCVRKEDMIILTSEAGGNKFVKAFDVGTLGIHDGMGQGNEIVRQEGATLIDAFRVPNDEGVRIALRGSGIFIEKNPKYTRGGVQTSALDPIYISMIERLKQA